MNIITNTTSSLNGTATIPGSKSQTIRALVLATLGKGESVLHNMLQSDDTVAAMEVCRALGASITSLDEPNAIHISSNGALLDGSAEKVNTKNSGITTRFIMPVLGLRKNADVPVILDCSEQMKARPVGSLIKALNNLGMHVESLEKEGSCPVKISGKLKGGSTIVDGLTSQYVSALLLSLPLAENDSEIIVYNLHERPYVEMTLKWLDELGIAYEHKIEEKKDEGDSRDIFLTKGNQQYNAFTKIIPGDFSSASYIIASAVMIPGEVVVQGLDMQDAQGDKRLVDLLIEMGADISIRSTDDLNDNGSHDRNDLGGTYLTIRGGRPLHGMIIDCNDIPDMVPTLAVIGTQAQGRTELVNVEQARIKETDRIHSMKEGLKSMGAEVEEKKDGLVVEKSELHGAQVHGYNDHRTIMSLAIGGLAAYGQTIIDTAGGINKTFPQFVDVMKEIGGKLSIE